MIHRPGMLLPPLWREARANDHRRGWGDHYCHLRQGDAYSALGLLLARAGLLPEDVETRPAYEQEDLRLAASRLSGVQALAQRIHYWESNPCGIPSSVIVDRADARGKIPEEWLDLALRGEPIPTPGVEVAS